MSVDLRSLRYFTTIAEELHFGRAATRLHMTQPPLSQAIQALEESMGARLFSRDRRHVALTAAGTALLPEARKLLAQAQALPAIARRAAAGEIGSLSLAFVSTADYGILPSLLRDFRERHPHVRIELREATTDIQLDALLHGQIDAGLLIGPLQDKLQETLDYLPVLSEPLVLAMPRNSALARNRNAGLAEAAEYPLIVFPRQIAPAFHDAILGCFRSIGRAPAIGQEAIQMQTIVGLVSAGMGIALVPQSVSDLKRPGVVYRALRETVPHIETGLAWRRGHESPVLNAILKLLRKSR